MALAERGSGSKRKCTSAGALHPARFQKTGGRPPVSAEPGHRGARPGSTIIAGTGDNRNRHGPGDAAPVFPAVELGQIVATHQPDEAPLRVAGGEFAQGVDGVAGAQFALDRGRHDRRAACHAVGRGEARASGAMPAFGFSGLPGETSHHTSSSPSASRANRLMRRCPPCAGLKLPPRSPVRVARRSVSGPTCPVPRTCHL
jgi:hypothetical protein